MPLNCDAEHRLLQAVLRADETREAAIADALGGPVDWARLVRMATTHGVLPLVYTRLRALAAERVPAEALRELQGVYALNCRRTLLLTADLVKVVRLLEAEGIPVLVLKGPALAMLLYGDPALRYFADLDLLVHAADYPRVDALLLAQGLRRGEEAPGEQAYLFPHRADWLEIHWRLADDFFPGALDIEHVFPNNQPVALNGQPVQTIGTEDTVLYLCLHALQHTWLRYRYLADFTDALRAMDAAGYEALLAAARRQGMLTALLLSMRVAHDVLGCPLPAAVTRAIARHPLIPLLARRIRRRLEQRAECIPDVLDLLTSRLLPSLSWPNRPRVLALAFTPTANDHRWLNLPPYLHWLYPLLRPIRQSGRTLAALYKRFRLR